MHAVKVYIHTGYTPVHTNVHIAKHRREISSCPEGNLSCVSGELSAQADIVSIYTHMHSHTYIDEQKCVCD